MNQLGSLGKKLDGAGDGAQKPQASMTELFSSAKVVAEAAQATVSGGKDKIDQGKAAGAAADLLGAASQYGKLDDKGALGGCVKKAETYLSEYEASHSTKPGGAAAPGPDSAPPATKTAPSAGEDEKKESNAGDYMKMAQGFFK